MPEEGPRSRAWIGMAAGAAATTGALVVGATATLYGMILIGKHEWQPAGLFFVSAALAFGLTANAIWRR